MHRIVSIEDVPFKIRKAFYNAPEPLTPYDTLWREVAARLILDGIGLTGHQNKPYMHNEVIRAARNWFRINGEDVKLVFDYAGMEDYLEEIKNEVLGFQVEYIKTREEI